MGLITNVSENLNVINFDGETVWSTNFSDIITEFSEWRLQWYETRYKRLADLLAIDIQRYKDVLRAIDKNVGSVAKKIKSRQELKTFLAEIEIIYVDYIADLPVYRFTEDEKKKVEEKLKDANAVMKEYNSLLKYPKKRRDVYISELTEILTNYKKRKYSELNSPS